MLNFGGVRVGFLLLLARLVEDSEYTFRLYPVCLMLTIQMSNEQKLVV